MIEINLRTSDEEITNIINSSSEADILSADIIGLTTNGKNKIRMYVQKALEKYKLSKFTVDATDIVLELVFNAVKAMYSHIFTIVNLKMLCPDYLSHIENDSYLQNTKIMRAYNEIQANPINRNEVKEMMRLEGELFNEIEHNKFSNDARFKRLHFFKKASKKKLIIKLIFECKDDHVVFSILNETPITDYAMNRIADKRKTFKEYYDGNKIDMFFIERLDNTESAGLGIAIIDLRLLTLGLEPKEHFKIFPYNYTNSLSILILPRD